MDDIDQKKKVRERLGKKKDALGLETERQKMLGVFNLMNLSDTLIDFQKCGKHFTQWKVVKRCQPKCFSETMYKSGREGGGVSAGG